MSIALGVETRAGMVADDINVTEMAARISVDRCTPGDWLSAKRPIPLPVMISIARELRVPPHELLKRAEGRACRDDVWT